ncbi:hypothetical protein CWR48_09195 [Oceanobacillus arenosus]|uniref:LysM domain-containing protein n=1 Tax=Oceanobacillus arenosus TaxID=1229153 RepID=A0A3D8PVA1_9BACI|nr:hypothetical protein [Oceanobacillus arenosus]RDW19208.1 hypothetical protein CWR48_09195 [Oceanobacillus arenosus]
MKRLMIYILFFLLCVSIYKDLSLERTPNHEISRTFEQSLQFNYTIMQMKITIGDTVLSVTEKINIDHINNLDISTIMADFEQLNPTADPYHLEPNTFYYFPLYK